MILLPIASRRGISTNQRNITGSDITVRSFTDIIFDASVAGAMEANRTPIGGANGLETRDLSRGLRGFAMIGNGGYDVDGDFSGDVTVNAGRNLHMIGSSAAVVNTVTNYIGNTVSGPTPAASGTTLTPVVGALHTSTALQEATMKQRTFTLYHGTAGASPAAFKGSIVPGTFGIDLYDDADASTAFDVVDNDAAAGVVGDGKGALVVNNDPLAGSNGVIPIGAIVGEIDYNTGIVTMFERVESRDDIINRNVHYNYLLGGVTSTLIAGERTPESDSATRASQAYLGHGGVLPGSVSLVIDANNNGGGRRVISDPFFNGILYNEQHLRVGAIDYTSGRILIEGVNTATGDGADVDVVWDIGTSVELRAALNSRTAPDEVVANYQYSQGSRDQSFIMIGNGGYSANLGGRNTPGHSGEIQVTSGGDIRLHGGAFDDASVQIGHGGKSSQGWHGYQTAQTNRANPDYAAMDLDKKGNITVQATGIIEMLAGRGISLADNEQYAQLGHGGYDADGNHQGNISVTSGLGNISSRNGLLGDTTELGGLVFTAGQVRDAYAQLGHGGFGARSSRGDLDAGAEGLYGNITVKSGGDVKFTAGTGIANLWDYDDARLSAQLGHGGYDADIRSDGAILRNTGIGHAGDISVTSQFGTITFQAGDHTKAAPGGAILGEGYGILHSAQLGHGGYSTQGDHHGNITVSALNNIQFYGGSFTQDDSSDKRNYVILGHGGDESEGYNGARDANNDPLDTISVTAKNGDVDFRAGSGRRNWAQLGNGGFSNNGDHVANIIVKAGGNVNFLGGQGTNDLWVNGEKTLELDVASFSAGSGGGVPGGWAPLRSKNIYVANAGAGFLITVNGFAYRATGATVQEADGDGAFTAANIVASADVDFNGDSIIDIPVGTIVWEIDLRTGHVRFFIDIDPTNTNAFVAQYAQASTGVFNNALENQITNPVLARAIQGIGNFAASSTNLQATFNNTRGGIVGVSDSGGSNFDDNIGIKSGTFRLNVPDGTVVQDDGTGRLIVLTVGSGSNLTASQQVGSIDYTQGQIILTSVINPNGRNGVAATYQLNQGPGSDLSYAQLGNGGYDADDISAGTVQNEDKSNVGSITVNAGGNLRFHAGNGADSYAQLGHGGYETKGANSGDISVKAGGAVEFLGGIGRDETDIRAYAMLGHGGHEGDGNHFGNITVTSGTGFASSRPGAAFMGDTTNEIGVLFKAGDREDNSVRMGHGGTSARSGTVSTPFGLNGNLTVTTPGSISFVGGTGSLVTSSSALVEVSVLWVVIQLGSILFFGARARVMVNTALRS